MTGAQGVERAEQHDLCLTTRLHRIIPICTESACRSASTQGTASLLTCVTDWVMRHGLARGLPGPFRRPVRRDRAAWRCRSALSTDG